MGANALEEVSTLINKGQAHRAIDFVITKLYYIYHTRHTNNLGGDVMSGDELFTAEGNQLLRLVQAGAIAQLVRIAPIWTSDDAKDFSVRLKSLYENINKLPDSRRLDGANHRFIVQAKLDCLKVAGALDDDLFKEFYADMSNSIEAYSTDAKRYMQWLTSLRHRLFMKLDRAAFQHDTRRVQD